MNNRIVPTVKYVWNDVKHLLHNLGGLPSTQQISLWPIQPLSPYAKELHESLSVFAFKVHSKTLDLVSSRKVQIVGRFCSIGLRWLLRHLRPIVLPQLSFSSRLQMRSAKTGTAGGKTFKIEILKRFEPDNTNLRGSITVGKAEADLLFILFGSSCFYYVELATALLVWSNTNQSSSETPPMVSFHCSNTTNVLEPML